MARSSVLQQVNLLLHKFLLTNIISNQNMQNTQSEDSRQQKLDVQDVRNNQNISTLAKPMQQKSTKTYRKKKQSIPSLVANLSDTKYPVVKKVLSKVLKFQISRQSQQKDFDIFWTDNSVQPQQLQRLKCYQKINHFPGMYTLSRKNYLARNLLKMAKQFPQDYNFYPKTWVLPSELNQLKKYMESQNGCVVIAKPEASSQGRGIFLTKNSQDFLFGEHYVVQKYLKKPFLIEKLKFDLRIYVLVAGCDPLRVYIYKEGLARFATEPYSAPNKSNLNNLFMHLTNYAINKHSQKFQFNTSGEQMNTGHKRSLTSVLNLLSLQGHNVVQLWNKIKDIILKTLISVQPILGHHYRSCQPQNYSNNMCFQILGFDVIIDQHLNPQILEVNYTPSFTTDTPLDKKIKQNLIRDALILMNITNKAKNQALNAKNRQIKERTLTGKKHWYTKQQRDKIVIQFQKQRDIWEDSHLGDFEKVFPLPNTQLKDILNRNQMYSQFLQYSEKSYNKGTGTNIKRSQKLDNANKSSKKQLPQLEIDPQKVKQLRQMKLSMKANQLQKIYKTKFRPMIPFKIRNNQKPNQQQTKKSIQMQEQLQNNNFDSTPKRQQSKYSPFKQALVVNQTQFDMKTKTCTPDSIINLIKKPAQQRGNKTLNNIKIDRKAEIYSNKMIYQRPTSAIQRKEISNVYNVTFKQISLKNNQSVSTKPFRRITSPNLKKNLIKKNQIN